jgi:RimJ/RimL family protein N-acetyltransferase
MSEETVVISELGEEDLPFLFELWHENDVMRYADELPGLRGWSRSDELMTAWTAYQARRAALGNAYTQFIICLPDGMRIGESFFAPLAEGYTFGRWEKPAGLLCLMGDIKLEPAYWGRGLGTEGMRAPCWWSHLIGRILPPNGSTRRQDLSCTEVCGPGETTN